MKGRKKIKLLTSILDPGTAPANWVAPTTFKSSEMRTAQKEMKDLAREMGAGWPIEIACRRLGLDTDKAYEYIRSDPQLQAQIYQLRGHPIDAEPTTFEEQIKQVKLETFPSLLTLTMIRDNPNASFGVRLKAAELLLKYNPDLVVASKMDADVVHRHVIELPQMDGLKALMGEVQEPSIEVEFMEVRKDD